MRVYSTQKRTLLRRPLILSKTPGVVKGRLPLKQIPALTACTSERMKPFWFSYLSGFAAREREREAKPVKTRKSGVQPLFRHSQRTLPRRPPFAL